MMLQRITLRTVLLMLLTLTSCLHSIAQDRLFVYRNTGEINAFKYSDVQEISCSNLDTLGVFHEDLVSQEIKTVDSLYLIPLAEIDSISFHSPANVYKEGVKNIDELRKYILSATTNTLLISPSIPKGLVPNTGEKIVTLIVDDILPMGFAGEVIEVNERVDGCIEVICTPLSLEDIFYSYYCSFEDTREQNLVKARANMNGKSAAKENGTIGGGGGSSWDDEEEGKFAITFNTISSSLEFEVEDIEAKIPGFPTIKGSGKFGASIECPDLKLTGYDIIVPDRGHTRHVTMEGNFNTKETFDFSVSKTKNKDIPFPIIGHGEGPTGVPLLSWFYEFGLFYDLCCSINAGVEFNQDWHLLYYYDSSNNKNPHFEMKPVGGTTSNGSICVKGSAKGGVYGEIGVKPVAIDKDAIGKVSGRFEAGIEISGKGYDINDLITAGSSTRLYDEISSDPFVKANFYESLSATAKIGPIKGTWEMFKGEIGAGFTLGAQIPTFSNVVCNRVSGTNDVRVTSRINNDCILPFNTGFAVFDNSNHKVKTVYYDETYRKSNYSSFGVEIADVDKNNKYKIHPIVKVLGYEILCNPSVDVKGNFDVVTVGTNSIGEYSASIAGYVEGNHSEHGLRYRKVLGNSGWITIKDAGTNAGNYSASLSGLEPRTEYQYNAYIVVEGKTFYGETLSFRTGYKEDPAIIPIAITGNSSNIKSTSANIECSYDKIPQEATCGYYLYAYTSSFSTGLNYNNLGCFEGTRNISLSNLVPATTYSYSAFVEYNGKYYDGSTKYFTTSTPEATADISDVKATSANIKCDYKDVPDGAICGFYLWSDEMDFGLIERTEYNMQGLEIDKTYYVRPIIQYNGTEYPSETITFKTLKPLAVTGKTDNITCTTARCFASYENVPEGAKCFMSIKYDENSEQINIELEPNKNVSQDWSELVAGHKYIYWATILFEDVVYEGERLTFTTKSIPVELSDFSVVKSEWKRNGFEVNGHNYYFKYNCSITATLKDSYNIEDWGYAYRDPNGDISLISLLGKGSSYTDTRYSYCRDEAEDWVELCPYVKFKEQDETVFGEGWQYLLVYDEEPNISFESAEITNVDAEPKYDGSGNYLFTWFTAGMKYVIRINGGYWIDYIQPIIYDNGSWSYNGGKSRVPGDGLYSVNTNLSYDNEANMNWSTGYAITLTDGSVIYTTNEIVVGGTPDNPTVSVGTSYAAKSKVKAVKTTIKTSDLKTDKKVQFGTLNISQCFSDTE